MRLTMTETMRGWLELNETYKPEPFEFTIKIQLGKGPGLLAPQPFRGKVRLSGRQYEGRTQGELAFKLSGPRYELDFEIPGIGLVRAAGEKTYSLTELRESLITCPLTIYHQGEAIGYAEVRYEDSIVAFPFRAFRVESSDSPATANF
ncbi:MAG: hypothetical protein R3208_07870 [Ketobacteraceae bacterium]|nr:hypothetical protein [Ketobacteraceae bacterium]